MKSVLSKQNKTTVGSCTYLWVFSVCITLCGTKQSHAYLNTWIPLCHQTNSLVFWQHMCAHRGQNPTSWHANHNPAIVHYTSRSAPQITVGMAPHECRGRGVMWSVGGCFWPCLTLFNCVVPNFATCRERGNGLSLRFCMRVFGGSKK